MNLETVVRRCLRALPLVVAIAAACSSPSPVDEVVASNLAARGGAERLRALRSLRETGTVTAGAGRVARVVRELKRPGMIRIEISAEGTKSVFANDGAVGWQVAPMQGQFEPKEVPADADSAGGVDQRDIEGPLVDWRQKGHTVELLGREKLPGGDAFKLRITMKGGSVRTEYVDVKSRQIVRSDVTRTVRGHKVQVESTFSDFRKEDGLVFPHRIESHVKDRPQELRIVVEKIEIDPEIADARFHFPR